LGSEGQPEEDNDPEWDFVIKWMMEHGQSFDWILSGDPRCIITTGAMNPLKVVVKKRTKGGGMSEINLNMTIPAWISSWVN